MRRGYIKLWRMLRDSPCWTGERFSRGQAWVDLLMMAARKDHTTRVRGILVPVKRGCVVAAAEFLASRWKWSKPKVLRWENELQNDKQVLLQKTNVITCIQILNWDKYQGDDTADVTTDVTAGVTANVPQNARRTTTQENGIEEKRIEENNPLSPPGGGGVVVPAGAEDLQTGEVETIGRPRRQASLTGLDLAGRIVRVVFGEMSYGHKDLTDWGLQFDRLMKDRGETAANLVKFCTWYEEHHGEKGIPTLAQPFDLYNKWVAICQASQRDF